MIAEYFTNPYDPMFKNLNTKEIYPQSYEKGIISTFSDIQGHNYVPVTLTVEKEKITNYLQVEGIKEILKYAISKLLNTNVNQVIVFERKEYYVFNPVTDLHTSVFENSEYLTDFYKKINLEEFIGYTVLSNSPLTRYIIHKWDKDKEILLTDLNVKYFLGCAIIPINTPNLLEIQGKIDMELTNLTSQGVFAYSFGVFDMEDREIITELCLMYDIKILDSEDLSTLILQTNTPFYTTPEDWIRYNLPLIKSGNFPSFTFKIFDYDDEYQRKYGTVFKDVILKYVSYMAFAELSDEDEIISPFIFSIKINEDLSITVNLPKYHLVQKYIKLVKKLLKINYNFEPCKDLREGVIKRWIVQKKDPHSYPMVFQDKTETDILVYRSLLKIDYSDLGEKELLEEMRNYYKKEKVCHDNLEPVTLDKISQMTLDELLKLVPITENKITYCFSNDTVSKIETNPLTRRPLSEKTLLRMKYIDYGLQGLFDVGVLYGLYSDIPTKTLVKMDIGIPSYNRVEVTELERQLVGNLFNVEIIYSDGTVTPLFQIALPTVNLEKIDEMKKYTDALWSEGFFLNYWISSVKNYMNLQSLPILIIDHVLLHAKDSLFDGDKALNYLRNSFLSL